MSGLLPGNTELLLIVFLACLQRSFPALLLRLADKAGQWLRRSLQMAPSRGSDAHWDSAVDPKSRAPVSCIADYRHAEVQSWYIPGEGGTLIACDFLLPAGSAGKQLPAVFFQTRYMRGLGLRWPLSPVVRGRPIDLINFEVKAALLRAGYALVTIDVRGTGASFGQWRSPWSRSEQQDALRVLDSIVEQPWSNGQVVLAGTSYEATAALFTASHRHPSVRGCVALYPFWDILRDIALPGGIANHSFTREWGAFCAAMDSNDFLKLPAHSRWGLKAISSGCVPVSGGILRSARADSAPSSKEPAAVGPRGRRWGRRRLREALAEHRSWEPLRAAQTMRFNDDVDPQSGLRADAISPCIRAAQLAEAGIPVLALTGWLDQTTTAAINTFLHTGHATGSELVIGPWAHTGFLDQSVGHQPRGTRSRFNHLHHVVHFCDMCCARGSAPAGKPEPKPAANPTDGPAGRAAAGGGQAEESGPARAAAEEVHVHAETGGGGRGWPGQTGQTGHVTQEVPSAVAEEAPERGAPASAAAAAADCRASKPPPSDFMDLRGTAADERGKGQPQPGGDREPGAGGGPGGVAESTTPVHYYVMGPHGGWRGSRSWPPQGLAPRHFALSAGEGEHGLLVEWLPGPRQADAREGRGAASSTASSSPTEPPVRWKHEVSSQKTIKGFSRYDAMLRLTRPVRYTAFTKTGHLHFQSPPLAAPLAVVGQPQLDIWVESTDSDADLFVYLEDVEPVGKKARYVTEGMFRASHRAEARPEGSCAVAPIGAGPSHSFRSGDAKPLEAGKPAWLRFSLLPTAYCFAEGHCLCLAVAGADARHFIMEQEHRTLHIHSHATVADPGQSPELKVSQLTLACAVEAGERNGQQC